MNRIEQVKLYYLFMKSDGQVSDCDIVLFNNICSNLNVSHNVRKSIVDECEIIEKNAIFDRIKDLTNELSTTREFESEILGKYTYSVIWNLSHTLSSPACGM